MKEGSLVIYVLEEDYARQLSGYLNRQEEFPYRAAVFTNAESLDSYLEQAPADILLLGEDCPYEAEGKAKQQILLTDERHRELSEPWIFKYQSAGNIMREISAYTAEPEITCEEGQRPHVSTVFATRGGQERSEYARALAKELGREGTVLFLNLDLFPAEPGGTEGDWKGMSEAVYYLKQGGEAARWKIKGLVADQDGIRVIRPVHCSMDLMELTPKDVGTLFEVLRGMKELDFVVLEVGFYNEAMLEICRHSDVVELVTPAGQEFAGSSEYFLGQLRLMRKTGVEKKVEVVQYGGTGVKAGDPQRTAGAAGFYERLER